MDNAPQPAGRDAEKTSRHRLKQLAVSVLGLYALYVSAAYVMVPKFIAGQAQELARDYFHSGFSARGLTFNPVTLSLHIDKPALADLDDKAIWFQAEAVTVNINALSSLFRREAVLDSLASERPVVRLQQDQNGVWRYPLMPVTAPLPASGTFGLRVQRLRLSGGQMHWRQTGSRPVSLTFSRVEYRHQIFNTGRQPSLFHLSVQTPTGGLLQVNGQYIHQTRAVDATWRAKQLKLPDWLKKWRFEPPNLSIQQATLSGNGQLRWHGQSGQLHLSARHMALRPVYLVLTSGRADTSSASDIRKNPDITVPSVIIEGLTLSLPVRRLHIQHLRLDQAVAHLPMRALGITGNQTQIPQTTAPASQQATPPLLWRIGKVTVSDSQLHVDSLALNLDTLQLDNLNNIGDNARILMKLDTPASQNSVTAGTGRIQVSGEFSLTRGTADLSHRIERVALSPWLPLAQKLLKISRINGLVSSTGQWRVLPCRLSGEFQATVSDFSLWNVRQQQVIAWRRWRSERNSIDSSQRRVRIGPMTIQELSSDIQLQAVGSHLKSLLRGHPAPTQKEKPAARPELWRIEWLDKPGSTIISHHLGNVPAKIRASVSPAARAKHPRNRLNITH